jgi:hypothetical protein
LKKQDDITFIDNAFQFGFVLTFGADKYCMNFDGWCQDMINGYSNTINETQFGSLEFAKAWVTTNVLCYIAQDLIYNTSAAMVAKGEWRLTSEVETRKVRKIDLQSTVYHVGMAMANSSAIASTNTSADGYAYAYTNSDELCNFLKEGGTGWGDYLCGTTNASSSIIGQAEASGISSGAARAHAGGVGAQSTELSVEADSIEEFSAFISAVAGSFAFASTQATVDAVTKAYLLASAASYVETCRLFVKKDCVDLCQGDQECVDSSCTDENCDSSYATDDVNTTSVGESLGRTLATSFDQVIFTLSTEAVYKAIAGSSSIYDQLTFGYEGRGYYGADVVAECTVPNMILTSS